MVLLSLVTKPCWCKVLREECNCKKEGEEENDETIREELHLVFGTIMPTRSRYEKTIILENSRRVEGRYTCLLR